MPRYRTRFDKKAEEYLNDNLPIDVLPYSNGEHFPEDPTEEQKLVMKIASDEVERQRRAFGMSRRQFVRTSAAFAICIWAADVVAKRKAAFGSASVPDVPNDPQWKACELYNFDPADYSLHGLPGEFIFDTQSHHVVSEAKWRVLQPLHYAFICGLFGVTSMGNQGGLTKTNVDTCENVGRWAYIKDIYLDSATTAGVLSPIPSGPDEQQPLPFAEADNTANIIENLAGNSERCVTHGYVMPNRGWVRSRNDEAVVFVPDPTGGPNYVDSCSGTGFTDNGAPNPKVCQSTPSTGTPLFLQDELDWMEERAVRYRRHLRGWKVYTPYGDVPMSSGMAHNDVAGFAMNDKIRDLNKRFGVPKVLASHKGVPLPTFDGRRQATDDVPGAAGTYPDIRFIIYHTAGGGGGGYNAHNYPYPGDPQDLISRPDGVTEDMIDGTNMNFGTDGLIWNLKNYEGGDLSALRPAAPNLGPIPDGGSPAWVVGPKPADLDHWNTINVGVDTGSQIQPSNPRGQAIMFAKMIKWLGPRRICYGTDCVWGGSPHGFIVFLRTLFTADDAAGSMQDIAELYNLPWGMDGDRYDPRVNAYTGAVAGYASGYSQAYLDAHPSLKDPQIGGAGSHTWPTSMAPHPAVARDFPGTTGHPERSIRNGLLGRNAADLYEHDADAKYEAIHCDEVQHMRDQWLGDAVSGNWEYHRFRSNTVYGPRTRQELVTMLNNEWAKNGWTA
jgi:uncharacterized protein